MMMKRKGLLPQTYITTRKILTYDIKVALIDIIGGVIKENYQVLGLP